jgi:hypothetical protein
MERGRLRHIKSVHISERVVQKCLCDKSLVPLLSRSLIYDNGASLKKKGLHFAIRRLKAHLSRYYREHETNEGYCLSIDFSKYFDTIRHDILFDMFKKQIQSPDILKLLNYFILPFGEGMSLGLGSQVCQISAIFYASPVDHHVKDKRGLKYYGRYMDDLYIIHGSREYLKKLLSEIKDVCTSLGITINKKKTKIVKLEQGVKFLKGIYTLNKEGRIISRADPASRKRMRRRLNKFKRIVEEGKMSYKDVYIAYQSWRGNYLKRFDAFHTIRRMDALYMALFINNHQSEVNHG